MRWKLKTKKTKSVPSKAVTGSGGRFSFDLNKRKFVLLIVVAGMLAGGAAWYMQKSADNQKLEFTEPAETSPGKIEIIPVPTKGPDGGPSIQLPGTG